jgi:hypothetical protein
MHEYARRFSKWMSGSRRNIVLEQPETFQNTVPAAKEPPSQPPRHSVEAVTVHVGRRLLGGLPSARGRGDLGGKRGDTKPD